MSNVKPAVKIKGRLQPGCFYMLKSGKNQWVAALPPVVQLLGFAEWPRPRWLADVRLIGPPSPAYSHQTVRYDALGEHIEPEVIKLLYGVDPHA